MYDMIIRQGTIIDGSGKPRFQGDVAIRKDRIAFVGTLDGKAKAKNFKEPVQNFLLVRGLRVCHNQYQ